MVLACKASSTRSKKTSLIDSTESGNTSIPNPEYKKIHNRISNLRQYFSQKKKKNIHKERAKLPSTTPGKGYRIYYTRYADNFLVGVNGPKRIAEELKEEMRIFLSEKLKLTLSKTKITRSDERVLFLGAHIRRHTSRTNDQNRRTKLGEKRKVRARMPQGSIIVLAPLERIVKRLRSQGICKIRNFSNRDVIPTRKTAWINLETTEIVQKYNEVWTGLLNYYSFAYNRSQLNFIQYLLHHSLACTLMNKLKINSRRQVFKKFGKEITVDKRKSGKPIKFNLIKSLKRINKFFF